MRRWWLLPILGIFILAGLGLWGAHSVFAPSTAAYREGVLQVLRGQEGGLDPGLAFLLRGLKEDLNCRDEAICLRKENFAFAFDLAEQYEHFFADYQGRICRSGRLRPSNRAEHEWLCRLLEQLFKEVGGVKMNASLALQFSTSGDPEEARPLLRRFLDRILESRERVLSITEELRGINWLKPVLPAAEPRP